MNGPDLTPINPYDVLLFDPVLADGTPMELYYSYSDLYAFWAESEDDHTLTEKLDEPKMPGDSSLIKNDFTALANSLFILGYIG